MSDHKANLKSDETKEKIRPYMTQMIMALATDQPDNVPLYISNWLQKYAGLTSTG